MTWERWQIMWAVALGIFAACKWLTLFMTPPMLSGHDSREISYMIAWPGLDAEAFLDYGPPEQPSREECLFACSKLLAGLVVFYGMARLIPGDWVYLVGWVGMVGIALILHFGIFHVLSCYWRYNGVVAKPLMNYPLAATGLSDFWGKRWNTAFRDLTHKFIFRPLASTKLGPKGAIWAGFFFSGLVHDAVISLTAGGGYGGPTAFFLLQPVGMFVERSRFGRRWGLGRGWRGWAFAAIFLLGPVGILFHQPFVTGIVVPFMKAAGAVS